MTDTFTYTIRDGDGDLAHTTLTITISDGVGPAVAGTLALTVNEAALDLNKDGADLAAGTVIGSNPSLTSETAQNSAGNQLTFTSGSDNIVSIRFTDPSQVANAPSINSGLDDGVTVTWQYDANDATHHTILGKIGSTTVLIAKLSGAETAAAGGSTVTPTVTVTLTEPSPTGIQTERHRAGDLRTEDCRGRQRRQHHAGTITVTVLDDVPTAIAPISLAATKYGDFGDGRSQFRWQHR